ncbi:hypothetical protein D1012_09715 [Pseudotabrizicola alkalilacus]|uniref:Uncharacterized protein n=1 Tax=Pseudotabrizicola alkalilacus TaxID=2305252 RepID=A0A411Z381_9RHOB|nr:hypothetical protein D1012_09715 [Pseudotabrizicola alkalilacus]
MIGVRLLWHVCVFMTLAGMVFQRCLQLLRQHDKMVWHGLCGDALQKFRRQINKIFCRGIRIVVLNRHRFT